MIEDGDGQVVIGRVEMLMVGMVALGTGQLLLIIAMVMAADGFGDGD